MLDRVSGTAVGVAVLMPPENRDKFALKLKKNSLSKIEDFKLYIMTIQEEYDYITNSVCLEHYLSL